MAEISNAQVVQFANAQVRPFADTMVAAYWEAKRLLADYTAGNLGSLIDAAGAGELLADGSESDGRTRITGGDIYNLVTAAEGFVAFVEGAAVSAADRRVVLTKPHVNRS